MQKIVLIAIVIGIITGVLFLFNLFESDNTNLESQSNSPSLVMKPSPTPERYPSINQENVSADTILLEYKEFQLTLAIPAHWNHQESTVTTLEFQGKKYYSGNIILSDPTNSKTITLIPNFQGGFCEGPSDQVQKKRIKNRFGLEGQKYTCGNGEYLVYGKNWSGTVFPNLFISLFHTTDTNLEVANILSSITYSLP